MDSPLRRCAASPRRGDAPCGPAEPVPRVHSMLIAPLLWLFGASLALAQVPDVRSRDGYEARVTRVSDGDTLWVQPLAGGRYRKLRLDGVDAPEICQEGGTAAREALAARVLQQVVTVRERSRDDYGRALARVQQAGEDVGAALVLQGQAWSYRWRHSDGPYAQEEAQARALRRGLFAQTDPEPPRDFRRRHGPCQPVPVQPAARKP